MNTVTTYVNKGAGRGFSALILTLLVWVLLPTLAAAQSYSGPLVITKGGTYTGNWESRDSEVAAIEIRTNEPVVILNSNVRGAGPLIRSLGNSADITVRHTNGYGLTPTPWRDYMKPRRFLAVDVFRNIVVENCYMEGTAGIYVGQRYEGNGSTANTIKIRYNKAKNIDGRVYGGGKALVQFVQFNFKVGTPHVEVAWNEVINEANNSAVEDNINIYNSRGTAASPIRIHNNFIQGAYPIPHNNTRYTGGGIITDGDGDINVCPAYITASDNQLVNLGNYSMGIAGGNNIRYTNNRAVNSAMHKDGSKFAFYTSGLWSKDYYNKNTTFSNSVDNNTVGITAWGYVNNRNDISVAQNAAFTNNTFLAGGAIAANVESDEMSRWTQKLQQNGIVLGPKGGATAVANQAPTVAMTAPLANASIALGSLVSIAANASDADGTVTKVEFFQGSTKLGEALKAPFTFNWSGAAAGSYNLTAKATDDKGATTTSAAVSIHVTSAIASTTPELPGGGLGATTSPAAGGIGSLKREFWANVPGNSVNNIPVTTTPTSVTELASFEAPSNVGDNYGQRVTGYVTAPVSGQYTFWIAGDNDIELYLSTSEDPARKQKIASMYAGWTNPREWTKYPSQQSAKITLEAGKRYYIEALMKEEGGGDNLAVGWQLPDGSLERPIAGNRLSQVGSTAPVAVATTGSITREFWANVAGNSVGRIPVTAKPTSVTELKSFEAPSNVGDNYGQRVRGYVTAPVSGQYTFWIAGDNDIELYLSTSEDPARKQKIASMYAGWTNPREWTKYPSQQSAKITLEAGKRYYIEALMKEEGGGDNLAVGWQLPDGSMERPIAGNRLSPITLEEMSVSSTSSLTTEDTDLQFDGVAAYPNPFRDVVTLDLGTAKVALQEVVILNQAGTVVYKESNLKTENNKLVMNLAGAGLNQGLYFLKYTDSAGKTYTIKLMKD